MSTVAINDKNSNRRIAFRIYEEANLFYHKIEENQLKQKAEFYDILDNVILPQNSESISSPEMLSATNRLLPHSQSQENDTLNVNISSTGIAFTCKDELKTGDYLMVRLLLLSTMTAIMTCCKVVRCKPSNPYETNRYPYLIGAQFVNMTDDDAQLLTSHVNKRKKQHYIINGLLALMAITFLAMPGEILHLLWGAIHHAIEVVLHLLHIAFELLEMSLDHLIEHSFHTGVHETQVIVFYIIVGFGFVGLYFLWRMIPPYIFQKYQKLRLFLMRKKSSSLYFWNEQSTMDKVKIITISLLVIGLYGYFGM